MDEVEESVSNPALPHRVLEITGPGTEYPSWAPHRLLAGTLQAP